MGDAIGDVMGKEQRKKYKMRIDIKENVRKKVCEYTESSSSPLAEKRLLLLLHKCVGLSVQHYSNTQTQRKPMKKSLGPFSSMLLTTSYLGKDTHNQYLL